MKDFKNIDAIFTSLETEDLVKTKGGKKRKVPGWAKLVTAFGSEFNDVTGKLGW
ncbi:hypothetical protein [Lactiplantibacillus paraplantarum]|uniref:Uncharacterized protein n=1 Tax=Lactiplantibacillus paraplantarum TaxID=60520 RepID=A0ABQ0N9R9_9LACO|nr:hypothetical protein [Lactiplantibacillus paraplantarum]ERL43685.1 hypothetical protein N644_2228 [Lactiplantibacillus paraplantarum]MCU4682575.1 hypothetical protein [Lactiplantibacillus paraplantarum]MDL2060662.1 hypothetical protein [Lactiplantibacillus paraplantarum]QJU50465.1 hypothetical protein CK401_01341 [Lactiplantibacillus paraplantarum]UKB42765.1 hypothetical protein L3503_06465 [Lactiplantibacillus paraplantarum]